VIRVRSRLCQQLKDYVSIHKLVNYKNEAGVDHIDVSTSFVVDRWVSITCPNRLSNISYGLSTSKFVNQTFLTIAIAKRLAWAIINLLDQWVMDHIIAVEALAGLYKFCMNYINAFKIGVFDQDCAFCEKIPQYGVV
jgi:hypothetical protein